MKRVFMRYLIVALSSLALCSGLLAQEETTLGKKIDELTYGWDQESIPLETYDGMLKFCTNAEYRYSIIGMLEDIHHYDSVLLIRLEKAARFSKNKEVEKTLKDIEKFETEYSMKEFIQFLYEECQSIREIEMERDDLEDEIGQESYDGKKYVIETELRKYIHHITKRVDVIRDHVHHLHIK